MSVTEVFADSWQEQSVGLQKGLQKRTEVLSELQQGFEVLSKTNHIKGRGADNMKAYISEVHMSLIHVLLTTVETFQNAIGVYWGGYDQIDSSGNFRLVNDELEQHVSNLKQGVVSTGEVALKIEKITNSVSDIMSFEFAGADRIREIQTSLDSMQQIAQNQKQNWEDYENSDHGFDQVDKLISQIEYYLPRLGQVTVGQGRGYQPGSFGTTLQKLSTTVSAAEKYNENNSKGANRTWNKTRQVRQKDVKQENKNEGWASFWVDAAFIAGGLALTVFSGGAALPLVLGGAAVAFNAADLAEDLDKAHYGKNQGFNLIRDGIYKNTFHLSSKDSKNLYTVTHFASDVASGGAFKDLAKSGIWVSKSQAVPLFKTAMKDFTQNGWKSGAKTLARTGISNSKYVLKNKGLAEGIIPRMNPIIKSELFGLTKKEASKQIARSFVRDAVKQKTVDQAKKWGAEQLTSAAQKAVGTNDKTDRKSQVINKLVQKGVGKAVGFADKKLIKSKSLISGTFRAVDNYHERDANGYISSKNEDLKILVTSIKRERAAN